MLLQAFVSQAYEAIADSTSQRSKMYGQNKNILMYEQSQTWTYAIHTLIDAWWSVQYWVLVPLVIFSNQIHINLKCTEEQKHVWLLHTQTWPTNMSNIACDLPRCVSLRLPRQMWIQTSMKRWSLLYMPIESHSQICMSRWVISRPCQQLFFQRVCYLLAWSPNKVVDACINATSS